MILYISDFNMNSSGYMGISISLCNELTKRGYDVLALGIGYKGDEHNWDFGIIPVETDNIIHYLNAMIHNLRKLGEEDTRLPRIEAIICALDIPIQEKLVTIERGDIPYIGIYPIESGPLCMTWASSINQFTDRLVISKFGLQQMEDAGVPGNYIPIGIDTESWRQPTSGERSKLREGMGYDDDTTVILTVADNQERKNLSAAIQIIARAKELEPEKKFDWVLVTRRELPVGWKLDDLLIRFDLAENTTIFDRGLAFEKLWVLYALSDYFLLTSKAEGLCMPIMEAMAVGAIPLATDCTAIPEHLDGHNRGIPLPVEFTTIDIWGNSNRSFVDVEQSAEILVEMAHRDQEWRHTVRGRMREYAEGRTWDKAADVLEETIKNNPRPEPEPDPAAPVTIGQPVTVPHPIPIMEVNGEQEEEQTAQEPTAPNSPETETAPSE